MSTSRLEIATTRVSCSSRSASGGGPRPRTRFSGILKYVRQEVEKVDAGSWHSRSRRAWRFILVFSHRESRATVICHIPRRHDQTQQWTKASEGGSGEWRLPLVLVRLTPRQKANRGIQKEKTQAPDNMVQVREEDANEGHRTSHTFPHLLIPTSLFVGSPRGVWFKQCGGPYPDGEGGASSSSSQLVWTHTRRGGGS